MGVFDSLKSAYISEKDKKSSYSTTSYKKSIQINPSDSASDVEFSDWDYDKAIKEGFKGNPVVYACVDTIASNVSSVKVDIKRKRIKGKELLYEDVHDGELYNLINRPNNNMTWSDLIEAISISLSISGKAPVYKTFVRGKPRELHLLRPDLVKPNLGKYGLVGYKYEIDNNKKLLDKDLVAYIKYIDPDNIYDGCSPMQAASKQIDSNNEMALWSYKAVQNKVGSNLVLHIEEPISNEEEFKEKKAMFNNSYQSSINAGSPLIISGGNKIDSIGLNAQDVEFIQSMKLNREFICGVYGVDSTLIGDKAASTRDNYNTAKEMLWHDTIIPIAEHIIEILNYEVVRYFGDEYVLQPNYSSVPALIPYLLDKEELNKKNFLTIQVKTQVLKNLLDSGLSLEEARKIAEL